MELISGINDGDFFNLIFGFLFFVWGVKMMQMSDGEVDGWAALKVYF